MFTNVIVDMWEMLAVEQTKLPVCEGDQSERFACCDMLIHLGEINPKHR